jgi:surface carbohydrate biosynthesis protein
VTGKTIVSHEKPEITALLPASDTLPVILPSETQSREFEAKLLLAMTLAERGVQSYVGSRIAIHNRIHTFPRSIYVAKDFRQPSNRVFNIMKDLGHHIIAWDEEAVLFFNAKEFHERRVHQPTFEMVESLFAWGPENASYLQTAPGYRSDIPVHALGNPRLDMLRPELNDYYRPEVKKLRSRFGKIILVNTNFGKLNHAVSSYVVRPGGTDKSVGGNITPFMQQAWTHRLAIFESFKALVPVLAEKFAQHTIIVRPHPAENHQTWRDVAKGLANVQVLHEGPVQNWLLAADAMVHNGCTTGIEAYLLGAPVVAYTAHEAEAFDFALANDLAVKAATVDAVVSAIKLMSDHRPTPPTQDEKAARLGKFFSGLAGPLASDLMASVIEGYAANWAPGQRPVTTRTKAVLHARGRAALKWVAGHIPDHKNSRAYSRQRFPGIDQSGVEDCMQRFGSTLGRFDKVQCRTVSENIFLIS